MITFVKFIFLKSSLSLNSSCSPPSDISTFQTSSNICCSFTRQSLFILHSTSNPSANPVNSSFEMYPEPRPQLCSCTLVHPAINFSLDDCSSLLSGPFASLCLSITWSGRPSLTPVCSDPYLTLFGTSSSPCCSLLSTCLALPEVFIGCLPLSAKKRSLLRRGTMPALRRPSTSC